MTDEQKQRYKYGLLLHNKTRHDKVECKACRSSTLITL